MGCHLRGAVNLPHEKVLLVVVPMPPLRLLTSQG